MSGTLNTLVLYTKGSRKDMERVYGLEGYTFVNTKRSKVKDSFESKKFEKVVVMDKGVSREDIEWGEGMVVERVIEEDYAPTRIKVI